MGAGQRVVGVTNLIFVVDVKVVARINRLRAEVRDSILRVSLQDMAKSWRLFPDGSYERRVPEAGEVPFNSQEHFMLAGGSWREE